MLSLIGRKSCASIKDTGTSSSTTLFFSSGTGDLAVFTVPKDRICFEDDEISLSEMDSIPSSIKDTGTWCLTTPIFSSGKGDLAVFTIPEDRICFEDDEITSSEIALFLDPLFPVPVVEACPKYET